MGRLFWIVVALGLAAAAGYAVVRRPPPVAAPPAPASGSAPSNGSAPSADETHEAHPNAAPHADIDDASRAELERILREADERDAAAKRR